MTAETKTFKLADVFELKKDYPKCGAALVTAYSDVAKTSKTDASNTGL
jgi:hypothetical protein